MDQAKEGGLSPTLFIIVMGDILQELHNKVHKVKIGYKKLKMVKFAEGTFADDLMIWVKTNYNKMLRERINKTYNCNK